MSANGGNGSKAATRAERVEWVESGRQTFKNDSCASKRPPLLFLCAASASAAPHSFKPPLAPSQYASAQYGLTFRVPKGATYCPLPNDWVGSDHGTMVFLERPKSCGNGFGYPSSGRDFQPHNSSRLELFYAYWMGDDEPPPKRCHPVGRVWFLGKDRPVCESRSHGLIVRTASARYMSDIEAKADLTLVTKPQRLARDMASFRDTAASFRTCSETWHDSDDSQAKAKSFTTGRGPPCPKGSQQF